MKAYGVPRSHDNDSKEYARKLRLGWKMSAKRKARLRRIWKRKERIHTRREIEREKSDLNF